MKLGLHLVHDAWPGGALAGGPWSAGPSSLWFAAVGAGPRTELNDGYHRMMLVVVVTGLGVLSTRAGRAALVGPGRPSRSTT